jgi:formamidopyrimidine-DNA glycosylase
MTGRRVVDAEVRHLRTVRHNTSPGEVVARLQGREITDFRRRGKFLMAHLDSGDTLVAHLGMSGRFSIGAEGDHEPVHTHFVARLDDGVVVRFVDPRTFGFIAVFDDEELAASGVAKLGPDAWTALPAANAVIARLAGRTAPIKALLLDQAIVSGLGNIYADEALHRAGIHPLRPGGELEEREVASLLAAIDSVLADAIAEGGTTLDDLAYLLPDGSAGDNLGRLAVYGREDQPCPNCGTPIERVTIRARSSHFCPNCQARR